MGNSDCRFVWYELATADIEGAKAFYGSVLGWRTAAGPMPGSDYTQFTVRDVPVAGLMKLPPDARASGAAPQWIGFVGVDDVDAAARRVRQLGGTVHVPPAPIGNVTRFSVVADPQMAVLALVTKPRGGQQPAKPGALGHIVWHELLASDGEAAFAFYNALLGWTKGETLTEPMGIYQQVSAGARPSAASAPDKKPGRGAFGSTISRWRTSMPRRAASRPAAAKSCTVRLQSRVAHASCTARTPAARCSA